MSNEAGQLLVAAGVVALVAALAWLARRRGGAWTGPTRQATLRESARLGLTPTHRLHQVETREGRVLLLATHPGGVTVVADLTAHRTALAGQSPELAGRSPELAAPALVGGEDPPEARRGARA